MCLQRESPFWGPKIQLVSTSIWYFVLRIDSGRMKGVQDSEELLSLFLQLDVNVLQGENRHF